MRLNLRVLSVGRLIFDWVSVPLCTFEGVSVRRYFVLFPGTVCVYSVSLRDEPRWLGWHVETAAAHRKGGSNRHPFGACRLPLVVAIRLAEIPWPSSCS